MTERPLLLVLDILVVAPSLIDTAGNALDLYDTLDWRDDANPVVNWFLLVAGFRQLLLRSRLGAAVAFGLAPASVRSRTSSGRSASTSPSSATTRTSSARRTRTRSAISGLSLLGSALAAAALALWTRRRSSL